MLLIPVMLLWLPESPRFLLKQGKLTPRTRQLLRRLNIEPKQPDPAMDIATGNPVAGLFRDGLAPITVLVWILYFANLISLYLIGYWLPTVLHMSGLTPADAVFAASLRDAGPLLSIFVLAPLSQRFTPQGVLTVSLAIGTLGDRRGRLAGSAVSRAAGDDLPDWLLHHRQHDRHQRHDRGALSRRASATPEWAGRWASDASAASAGPGSAACCWALAGRRARFSCSPASPL